MVALCLILKFIAIVDINSIMFYPWTNNRLMKEYEGSVNEIAHIIS